MKNVLSIALGIGTIVFGTLYLSERSRPPQIVERIVEKRVDVPRDVIKEVPVDRIVEKEVKVPVEVVKEVPARMPPNYDNALALYNGVVAATPFTDESDAIAAIPNVGVDVSLNDQATRLVDAITLKTKIELELRRLAIPIDSHSLYRLSFSVDMLEGKTLGGQSSGMITYSTQLKLIERLLVFRPTGWRTEWVPTWSSEYYGFGPYSTIASTIQDNAVNTADQFANLWLGKNPNK
jgi:hypothetical protein